MNQSPSTYATKLKLVAQESSAAQPMVLELEHRIIGLQNEVKLRDIAMLEIQDDSKNKQQELDKTIEEVLDWVPRAIVDAQRKHDYTYRLLLQTSSQLMSYQRQLKIPMSPSFARELKECSPNETIKIYVEAGDQAYEQEVAKLNERVAYLEARLANAKSEGECAQLGIGLGRESDESETKCLEDGHAQLESGSVRNSISVLGSMSALRPSATVEKAYPQPQRGESSDMRSAILATNS
ncbi:hypothetical protein FB446DRAFT_707646 [Lentinula raphanica]|nr:hypothetical protein FB446DRAFT_707646 [Lentinula raphanica]